MARTRIYDYQGRRVTVRYEAKRCIHAEVCITGLPGVFERDRRPWLEPGSGVS